MITLKSPDQIKRIEESCRLLAQLLDNLESFISAEMTTKEIDTYCYNFITKHKGRQLSSITWGFLPPRASL